MSRMADLHIDIITELSKESKEFEEAIECGCEICESYTIDEINKQLYNYRLEARLDPLRVVKASS